MAPSADTAKPKGLGYPEPTRALDVPYIQPPKAGNPVLGGLPLLIAATLCVHILPFDM